MKTFLYVCAFFLLTNIVQAQNTTLFESVMKVKSGNSYGTATFINEDADNYYALTNYHVTEGRDVQVKCYRAGHESIWFKAENIWNAYSPNEPKDMSLLRIKKSQLNWRPSIIKFDWDDKIYKEGDTITTIGCAGGKWPEAFQGHIDEVRGGRYIFTPVALPGRSGSVLFNKDATKAIGLIAWMNGEQGIAMNIEVIKNASRGARTGYYYDQPYKYGASKLESAPDVLLQAIQCGPRGCPPRFIPQQRRKQVNPQFDEDYNDGPEQFNPEQDEDEGFKIFPSYPEDQQNPNPQQPETDPEIGPELLPKPESPDVTPELLEKHKDFEKRMDDFDARLDTMEENQDELGKKQDELGKDLGSVKTELGDISNKLDDIINKPKDPVVTPGNIHEYSDKILGTVPGQLKEQAKQTKQLAEIIKESNTNINQRITDLKTSTNNSVKEYVEKTIEKTVVQDRAIDRNYGLVETATGPTILSVAGIIAMWLYNRWFGGKLKSPPFVLEARANR